MARITVEDCIDKFPSRFELVLVASNRARKLHAGENPSVEIDNDKNTVIALREIAEETITIANLKNDLIEEYQTNTFSEDEDLDEIEDSSDENQSKISELETFTNPCFRDKGAVVVFPSWVRHRVTPVTRGTRYSAVAWFNGPPLR